MTQEEQKIVDACEKILNGANSSKQSLVGFEFLIQTNSKVVGMDLGYLIRHLPKENAIFVQRISGPKAASSTTPAVKKIEIPKIDPNDPFSDYVSPKVIGDMISILSSPKTTNMWIFGPTQCGKSRSVFYVGQKMGRKIFPINCLGDMDSHHFFGRNTVKLDEKTGQNHIVHVKGVVELAMTEGLDEKGNVIGPAGILFIDEAGAMPTEIGIGLNRLFECTKNERIFQIEEDGNRIVKSHPDFRIILASNTNGTGATDMASQAYTAQQNALDASLLQRMSCMVRFGYDRKAEEIIVRRACDNEEIIEMFLKFKQAIRDSLKREVELTTPFSTKKVIDIFSLFPVFVKEFNGTTNVVQKQALGKAIYYASYELLTKEEKKKYDELWFGLSRDLIGKWSPSSDVNADTDYM